MSTMTLHGRELSAADSVAALERALQAAREATNNNAQQVGLEAALTAAIAFAHMRTDGVTVDRLLAIKRDIVRARSDG